MRTPERGGTNDWGHQMLGTTVSSKYLKCNYENVLIKLMHTTLCSHVALVLKCQPVCTSLVSSRTTRTKELANSPDSDGCCTLLQCIIEACWGSFLTLLGFSSFMAFALQHLPLSNLFVPNGAFFRAVNGAKWVLQLN